ncbi:hypothetical protein [Bacillus fungorum]|uniref:hypothetical protein n=1 Tax=Bacillus fungorum TaxID=2039284 RepID=UPI00267A930D
MFKKLIVGALAAGIALTGGIGRNQQVQRVSIMTPIMTLVIIQISFLKMANILNIFYKVIEYSIIYTLIIKELHGTLKIGIGHSNVENTLVFMKEECTIISIERPLIMRLFSLCEIILFTKKDTLRCIPFYISAFLVSLGYIIILY